MNKKVFDILKNHTKPGNPYYFIHVFTTWMSIAHLDA